MIRKVTSEDFKKLLKIEAQASPKSQYDLWELKSLHWRHPKTFLVSVSDQIDGYIVFSPDGHVISMAVRPERRRRGIGTRLINEALAHCPGKSLRLEVRVSNLGAEEFYLKLGFQKRAIVERYYHDGEDALTMERPAGDSSGSRTHDKSNSAKDTKR
jgi:ribosomal-protein-alanine N-acetyltransferase